MLLSEMLTYRDTGTSGTQLAVYSHELRVAHIGKQKFSVTSGGEEYWRWDFAFNAGPPDFQAHGSADDLDGAKAAVERNWQAWLQAAGLHE